MPRGKSGPRPEDKKESEVKANGADKQQESHELFKEPEPVIRSLSAKLNDQEMTDLRKEAADIAVQIVEQEQIAENAKETMKGLEAQQRSIVARLRLPIKYENVKCFWKIDTEANSKTLVRADSEEAVETRPLSEEDRAAELSRLAAQIKEQGGVMGLPK